MPAIKKLLLPLFLVAAFLVPQSCRISYKLNGAAIDYTVYRTIHVGEFPIRAALVYAPLQQTFENELMDYYAIGQCTPGVIAVNTSTFIGYRLRGVPGAIVATAGMVFPSLVIITIIAAFIQQFAHLAVVQHAFAGIRVAVCALVLQSVWKMAKKGVVDLPTGVILVVTFAAVAFFGVSPVLMVVIATAAGILINVVRGRRA